MASEGKAPLTSRPSKTETRARLLVADHLITKRVRVYAFFMGDSKVPHWAFNPSGSVDAGKGDIASDHLMAGITTADTWADNIRDEMLEISNDSDIPEEEKNTHRSHYLYQVYMSQPELAADPPAVKGRPPKNRPLGSKVKAAEPTIRLDNDNKVKEKNTDPVQPVTERQQPLKRRLAIFNYGQNEQTATPSDEDTNVTSLTIGQAASPPVAAPYSPVLKRTPSGGFVPTTFRDFLIDHSKPPSEVPAYKRNVKLPLEAKEPVLKRTPSGGFVPTTFRDFLIDYSEVPASKRKKPVLNEVQKFKWDEKMPPEAKEKDGRLIWPYYILGVDKKT